MVSTDLRVPEVNNVRRRAQSGEVSGEAGLACVGQSHQNSASHQRIAPLAPAWLVARRPLWQPLQQSAQPAGITTSEPHRVRHFTLLLSQSQCTRQLSIFKHKPCKRVVFQEQPTCADHSLSAAMLVAAFLLARLTLDLLNLPSAQSPCCCQCAALKTSTIQIYASSFSIPALGEI